jgi:tellurite resistance protein
MIDAQSALIYTMVLASASDSDMTDAELGMIGDIVQHLPIFNGFDANGLPDVASRCVDLLSGANGLDHTLEVIASALPERLRETAYALACDIVAADGAASQEELRLLELLRHRFDIERLVAAAIERGARARFAHK